jgi:hypothetical protein
MEERQGDMETRRGFYELKEGTVLRVKSIFSQLPIYQHHLSLIRVD